MAWRDRARCLIERAGGNIGKLQACDISMGQHFAEAVLDNTGGEAACLEYKISRKRLGFQFLEVVAHFAVVVPAPFRKDDPRRSHLHLLLRAAAMTPFRHTLKKEAQAPIIELLIRRLAELKTAMLAHAVLMRGHRKQAYRLTG